MLRNLVRYVLLPLLVFTLLAGVLFLTFVGPWPAYRDSGWAGSTWHAENLQRMNASVARSELSDAPGRLHAGWAERDMTPPVGVPLGGYSGRPNAKRNTGVHDPIFARALVLSDGTDTVALVGADLLMTTINVAERVWAAVAEETGLTPDDILFTTSHTHCATGGFMPGLVGEYSAGAYDEANVVRIAEAMAGAILEAYAALAPARIAHREVRAPEFIYNRTNVPGEDDRLDYLVLENEAGARCYGVRYSAHATVLPQEFLEVSAEYPGALTDALRNATGDMAVFFGGAVGAMGPEPPERATPVARMQAMGDALAQRILDDDTPLEFRETVDIASLGTPLTMPSMQVRPFGPDWRLSPYFGWIAGVPNDGYLQAVRVGDLFVLGLPYDAGGDLAADWADALAEDGIDLWVTSHCIAYCGYLTRDEYYDREPVGYDQNYEWRVMNWFGPGQEALFTALKDHARQALFAPAPAR